MKGLSFIMARRAFPPLRLISLALLRLLQMGGGEERRRTPSLVFPKAVVSAPGVSTSTLVKERFFSRAERLIQSRFFSRAERLVQSSREIEKTSSLARRIVSKGAEKQFSFFKKSRVSRHNLKESLWHGGKDQGRHLGDRFESKYVSRWASLREHSAPAPRPAREGGAYFTSLLKENNLKSTAFQSLLREAFFDKKESRTQVNTSFLKESMRESFTHLREKGGNAPPSPGGRIVNIGTIHIEGAQIRDFESFKRELSLAVEDL